MSALNLSSVKAGEFGRLHRRSAMRNLCLGPFIATGLSVVIGSAAHAQTTHADTVIVTASRLDWPDDPTVLQIPDDEVSLTTLDALERLPGVTAFRNGGSGGSSFLSVRGGEPNFTLVLFDGIRLNDSTNSAGGAFDFSQIDPAFIGRLEVDRSTGSAIHGSDALSGVVNILTSSPTNAASPALTLSASLQTEGGYAVNGLATQNWQGGGASLGAARRDSGSLSDDSTLLRDAALLRLDQSIGTGELRVTAYHAKTDRVAYAEDSGGVLAPAGPILENRETTLNLLGLRYAQPVSETMVLHGAFNVSEQSALSDIPAIPGGVFDPVPARVDDTKLQRWEGQAFLRTTLRPDWRVVAGVGYSEETGRGVGTLDIGFPLPTQFSETRETASAFMETAARLTPKLTVEGAVRYDTNNVSADSATYKVGGRYRVSGSLQLHAGHSKSYKLPSIFATSYPLIANPDLEPETSRNFDAGLILMDDLIGRFEVTAHHTKFRKLIDFDPDTFTNVNRQSVSSQGLELMWERSLSERLEVSSALTLNHVDTSSDQPLRNRPKVSANAHLSYQLSPRWSGYTAWRYVSGRYSSSVPTGFVRLDDFQAFDVGLIWSPKDKLHLRLDLVNGFNANYTQAVGVRELKRHLALTISQTL
jgi:iron complex outermembrane receptor protein/vitamin B12 transporter